MRIWLLLDGATARPARLPDGRAFARFRPLWRDQRRGARNQHAEFPDER